jgi:hypothetical protein
MASFFSTKIASMAAAQAGQLVKPVMPPAAAAPASTAMTAAAPGSSYVTPPQAPAAPKGLSPTVKYALLGGGFLGVILLVVAIKKSKKRK